MLWKFARDERLSFSVYSVHEVKDVKTRSPRLYSLKELQQTWLMAVSLFMTTANKSRIALHVATWMLYPKDDLACYLCHNHYAGS